MDSQGNPQTEEVGIIHVTGSVAVNLDEQTYTHSDLGRCIFNGDSPEALDMALAGCVTDCLKRCFRQLGEQFGLSLYDKEIAATAGTPNGANHAGGNGSEARSALSGRTSVAGDKAQSAAERIYLDGSKVNGNESERSAFDAFLKTKGQAPRSRDALREWMRATQPTAA